MRAWDAEVREEARELVLDDIGECADDEQRRGGVACGGGQGRDERGEAGILALRERRLDAAARIAQHTHARCASLRLALRGTGEVDLDDLRRAGADQKEKLDVGATRQQLVDDAVELVVDVGEPGEIALVENGGGEARLREDHHAGGGLHEMRAGAGADDEKEGVADLAMQPDDPGQAAEYFPLSAFLHDRGRRAAGNVTCVAGEKRGGAHDAAPAGSPTRGVDRRAARNFRRNCVAFTT